MENKQYEHDSLNQKDLFQEYIDSLPEEEEEKAEETERKSSGLSKQVEEDLRDYQRRGYDSQRSQPSSSSRSWSRRASADNRRRVGVALIAAGSAIMVVGLTATMIARNSYTYTEPVYYEEPYVEEYEDPWEAAYQQMSGSLSNPEAVVEGHYVSLPVKVSDFMQEDWKIRSGAFSGSYETIGSEPVALRVETDYGYSIAEISVVSPTGEEVPLNDAIVTGISFDSTDAWVELNGGISIGSNSWIIEDALNTDGTEWTKKGGSEGTRYIVESVSENEYGYDDYVLRLELVDDYTERIVMQMNQGE